MAEITFHDRAEPFVPHELRDPEAPVDTEEVHELDTQASKQVLAMVREWWSEANTIHSENRYQQAIDADFYDGDQWRADDAQTLQDRGQAPLVFNVIKHHIRWILGTERRTRVDFKVHGRGAEDEEPARTKTKLMKYVSDVNKSAYARSLAFKDASVVGIGWLETGIRSDAEDEPLYDRHESWKNMWHDALAKDPDKEDGRYLFRAKWVDEDIGLAMFPERKPLIKSSAITHELFAYSEDDEFSQSGLYSTRPEYGGSGQDSYQSGHITNIDQFHVGNRRRRVRLIECWYKVPTPVQIIRAKVPGPISTELFSELQTLDGREIEGQAPESIEDLKEAGYISVNDAIKMKVHVAVFCERGLLQNQKTPYRHNRYPFTPIVAFTRDRDGLHYGPVRDMRDPQEDLNKRHSKALFILSTNRTIADEDAVEDWDEYAVEVAKPNAIIKKHQGAELEIDTDTSLAREHLSLMESDIVFMEKSSGVTGENKGESTNAISGTAISLRQSQGSVVTADLFDNLRYALQIHGEKQLSLIEQFYSEPKRIRITNDRQSTDFLDVNMPRHNEETQEDFVENDITRSQADFIVDTQDFRETLRLAMFESMMNVLKGLDPEVQMQLLDMVVDLADLPGREEMVRRIRDINGQIDPDSPEAEQQIEQRKAKQDEESALEKRAQEAEIRKVELTGDKMASDISKTEGDTMAVAAEIATQLALNPGIAAAVDQILAAVKEQTPAVPDALPTIEPEPQPTVEAGPAQPAAPQPFA